MAKESHNFKFDIYLLMITENVFIVILGLQGHKRMGKTCAPKMLCFLRHPSAHIKLGPICVTQPNFQPFGNTGLPVEQLFSFAAAARPAREVFAGAGGPRKPVFDIAIRFIAPAGTGRQR